MENRKAEQPWAIVMGLSYAHSKQGDRVIIAGPVTHYADGRETIKRMHSSLVLVDDINEETLPVVIQAIEDMRSYIFEKYDVLPSAIVAGVSLDIQMIQKFNDAFRDDEDCYIGIYHHHATLSGLINKAVWNINLDRFYAGALPEVLKPKYEQLAPNQIKPPEGFTSSNEISMNVSEGKYNFTVYSEGDLLSYTAPNLEDLLILMERTGHIASAESIIGLDVQPA